MSAALYAWPLARGLLHANSVGPLLVLGAVVGLLWLASLFSYAFRVDMLPPSIWQAVAVPGTLITAYSLASFIGYRLTRLAILPMGPNGVIFTCVDLIVGSACAIGSIIPLIRLARFSFRPRRREGSPIS